MIELDYESAHLIETPYSDGRRYWAGVAFLRIILLGGLMRKTFLSGRQFPDK